ncbi:hypothetical protein IEQ34_000880 [Dendrobium chrysotoxum]|uniref:ribulose-phosphate 3-epimerase n=1 Tax=Dendrobium chrysotoxum TaxID=161865 RepID=A0AAV7HRP3_DENCH|nr:hypothetical protein IEQ34_000880 [Dendrobium chrysotoxum]
MEICILGDFGPFSSVVAVGKVDRLERKTGITLHWFWEREGSVRLAVQDLNYSHSSVFCVIMNPPDPDITDGQSASQAAPVYSSAPTVGSDTVSQFATLIAQMMGEAQSRVPVARSEEVDRHLQMFLRLKPPRFEGTVVPREADDWLRRLEKTFDSMQCPSERKVMARSHGLFFFSLRHFVPNLTIGAPVIESLRKHTKAYLDCHLMVTNPIDYVEPFAKAGASGFTFHLEVSKENWKEIIQGIKLKGMRPGVALKPGTPIEEVYPLVESENPVEMVLVMTVEPGFGGQKFMPEMMDKVDGGLGPSTIDAAAAAGANCIVAGSSVFGAEEPAQVISALRKSVEGAQQRK